MRKLRQKSELIQAGTSLFDFIRQLLGTILMRRKTSVGGAFTPVPDFFTRFQKKLNRELGSRIFKSSLKLRFKIASTADLKMLKPGTSRFETG